MKFDSLIFPYSDKSAQEPDSEQQFEQDFARMAFAALEDRATKLVPHVVAFELVRREDDGSRAVGMFGLKVDGKYYYIPAFFRNGRLLPLDELLDKKSNVIMPLSEAQIDKVLGNEAITLGRALKPDRRDERNFERPSLDFIRNPKAFQKMAGEGLEPSATVLAWAEQLGAEALTHPVHSKIAAPIFARLAGYDVREGQEPGDLQSFLTYAGATATNSVLKTAAENPEFAAAIYSVYPSISSLPPAAYKRVRAADEGDGQLHLITSAYLPPALPAEKVAEVVQRGWTLWDRRRPEQRSEATDVDMVQCYGAPDRLGMYRVALVGGRMAPALVVPYRAGVAVVAEDGAQSFTANTDALAVRTDDIKDPKDSLLLKVDELKADRTYVMAHPMAQDGYAFRVESVIDEDGKKVFQIWTRDYVQHSGKGTGSRLCGYSGEADPTRLEPVSYADRDFTRVMDGRTCTLLVPEDWRFVELDRAEREARDARRAERKRDSEDECDEVCGGVSESASFAPGTMFTVSKSASEQGAHRLTIRYNGEWTVENMGQRTGPMNEKLASIHLARGYRLPPEQAASLLGAARRARQTTTTVVPCTALYPELLREKAAQAQINTPPMPDAWSMSESGIPVQTADVNFASSPTLSAPRETGRDPWFATVAPTAADPGGGGEPPLPDEIQQLAQQAGEMGQRTLFDHATIGGLVRMYDLNGFLDQMRPKFKTALDGLGRVLFLLKWKRDDFEDRFGPQDTSEFTDLARTVFRSFGDLVLKMEERSPSDENNVDPLARA